MNPYIKASLEELVELVNGNIDNHLPPINTHEEFLQAVEEHNVLTAELHKHIDEFHKHCDNVDIANAASVIVQEIKSKGISVEDDMTEILAIISKNTGIKVSTEEILTAFVIVMVVVIVINIITSIVRSMTAKKRLNEHIDKELSKIIKDFDSVPINHFSIDKELSKIIKDTVGSSFNSHKTTTNDSFSKADKKAETFDYKNYKLTIKRVPAFLSEIHGDIKLELKQLEKATNEFYACVGTIHSHIGMVNIQIMLEASRIMDLQNSAVMCIMTKTEDKHNEAVKKYKESDLSLKANEIDDYLIQQLQKISFSKADNIPKLQKEFTLINKEVIFSVNNRQEFITAAKENAKKLLELNKDILDKMPKIEKNIEQNKDRISKIKDSFEKNKESKDLDYHKYLVEISNIGGKRIKELEHEFFSLVKIFNICGEFVQMHYQFIKELESKHKVVI